MKRLVCALLFLPALVAYGEETATVLTAEQWAPPRHGEWLVQLPALTRVVAAMLHSSQSTLTVRYPGGESGSLWADELQDWLVSLGIPSSRIEMWPGASRDDVLELAVDPSTVSFR